MVKKGIGLVLGLVMFLSLLPGMSVLAEEAEKMEIREPLAPVIEEGGGAGSMANPEPALVEAVHNYAAKHIDPEIFASIHIDWVNEQPVIVLSVTEPLGAEQEKELKALAGKEKLKIRIVDYSEKELLQKQEEIDMKAFESEGVKIWSVGINVWENRVEVAIEPFNQETARLVYDKYGKDMIKVVEGHEILDADLPVSHEGQMVIYQHTDQGTDPAQATISSDAGEPDVLESAEDASPDQAPFFKRIWLAITQWVSGLFS